MKERVQPTEIQNYSNLISTPEIFISDIDGVQVVFILNFVSAPDFRAKILDFNHSHTSFELQYISKGSMEELMDNKRKIKAGNGELLLIPPHIMHKNISNTLDGSLTSFAINFTIIDPSEKNEPVNPRHAFCKTLFSKVTEELIFKNDDIARCMDKIAASASDPSLFSSSLKLYLRLIFEELILMLNAMHPQIIEKKDVFPTQHQIDSHRKWLIDAYVSNYYMCKNHIENMAYILNLSPRQTSRIVKSLTNETLQTLILNQRMSIALEKIKYTDMSLNQISEMIGYSSYTGFYVAFCNHFGYSPEKLRENDK